MVTHAGTQELFMEQDNPGYVLMDAIGVGVRAMEQL